MENSQKKKYKKSISTRNHKALFDNDLPFRHKVEGLKKKERIRELRIKEAYESETS